MDAVDTLRLRTNAEMSADDISEYYGIPTMEPVIAPVNRRYPWAVTWPDGQVTTYKSRAAAQDAVLGTVRHLWTAGIEQ